MEPIEMLPDVRIEGDGIVSTRFLSERIGTFKEASRYVQQLPYGYNSDRDDLMILFREKMGSCTTKHAVIATLASELGLPVVKHIGIYAMTEDIVTGAGGILEKYQLPYVPMVHCFLVVGDCRVDLTEGNRNGKNRPIDVFLHTEAVSPDISEKDEYLRYRTALKNRILTREELEGVDIKRILHAREDGIQLLRDKV